MHLKRAGTTTEAHRWRLSYNFGGEQASSGNDSCLQNALAQLQETIEREGTLAPPVQCSCTHLFSILSKHQSHVTRSDKFDSNVHLLW